MESKSKTHFGYRSVDTNEKAGLVGQVFDSVAGKYDLMNDVMSFGVHRLWKEFTLQQSGVREGQCVLDVAAGTGDLALKFSRQVGKQGLVVVSDINASMLNMGRDRLTDSGVVANVDYAQADAEKLPFADETFHCVCIAFGLRNVTHKDAALRSFYRVVKPGGRLLVLEFSKPVLPLLSKIYDRYSFSALPKLGKWIANDEQSYRYLAESIRMHPDQQSLKNRIEEAGFDKVDYFNLSGGIVALHKALKF